MDPRETRLLLDNLPARPWTPVRTQDERGWGISVVDAKGSNIGDREVYVDDAALMATLHASAPEAISYVLTAAERGGAEAVQIARRFADSYMALTSGPTPPRARRIRR